MSLTPARVAEIVRAASAQRARHEHADVWTTVAPLLEACAEPAAADALAYLLSEGAFERNRGLELCSRLLEHHAGRSTVVVGLGLASEKLVDLDDLNAARDVPVLARVADALRDLAPRASAAEAAEIDAALAQTARLLGRSGDDVAEAAYLRLVRREPERWGHHYDLGLFYKTRGRFREGQAANQRAFDLGGGEDESVRWNLGICATGARDAATALRVWRLLGQKIEHGRFDLPEGRYHAVKVRLVQRPLAERTADADDPGLQETVWVERLSPCHGVVRSALFYDDIGVEYGDAVLFDGAPLTHQQTSDGKSVPVFPHLATLVQSGYLVFPFVGTQQDAGQLAALSAHLPGDAVVYAHSEQMVFLCAECARGGAGSTGHRHAPEDRHRMVRGKVCAPPHLGAHGLREALDAALGQAPDVSLHAPELSAAAGDLPRAEVEREHAAQLEG